MLSVQSVRFGYCVSVFVSCRIRFFFQAEDGIRDDLVTGVQTCALPIFRKAPIYKKIIMKMSRGKYKQQTSDWRLQERDKFRSEERRVGKECRSRWSQYH